MMRPSWIAVRAAALLGALATAVSTAWAAETQITVWNKTTDAAITAEINGTSLGSISPGLFYRSTQPAVGSDVQGTVMYDVRLTKSGSTAGCRAQLFVNVTRGLTVGCTIEPATSEGGANCAARHWYYMTATACAAEVTIQD